MTAGGWDRLSHTDGTDIGYVDQMVSKDHEVNTTKQQRTSTRAGAESGSKSKGFCVCSWSLLDPRALLRTESP